MRGGMFRVGTRQPKQDREHIAVKTFVRVESESARITDQKNGGVSRMLYSHADWTKVCTLYQETRRVSGTRGVRVIRDPERVRSKLEVSDHRSVDEHVYGGEPP
eukprot:6213083-Pleurochrysis_carterae.AAC.1